MKHHRRGHRASAMVSASELAQMGRCEQLVVFEHRHGRRRLAHQEAARRRGLAEHARFEREGLMARAVGSRHAGRCLVATLLFGEAWQTQVLREFRDSVLLPRCWGRSLTRLYYLGAPGVCAVLVRWPLLRRFVQSGLSVVAAAVRWMMGAGVAR